MKGQSVIDVARAEIGTVESPANSNKTKYGKWANFDSVAWCGIFVSWCYEKAGTPLPKIGFMFNGFAGCQTAVAYFKKNGKMVSEPEPGDIVFFDWNADGRYDHTGIFVRWQVKGESFISIEGNTAVGNNSNGGKVMQRNRSARVAIFVRP